MIDHDHGHAEFLRLDQRLDAGGAAVDRHQQRRAFRRERLHRFRVRSVALEQPVRNMNQRIEPAMTQVPALICSPARGRLGGVLGRDGELVKAGQAVAWMEPA